MKEAAKESIKIRLAKLEEEIRRMDSVLSYLMTHKHRYGTLQRSTGQPKGGKS